MAASNALLSKCSTNYIQDILLKVSLYNCIILLKSYWVQIISLLDLFLEGIFQNPALKIQNLPDSQVTNLCETWGFFTAVRKYIAIVWILTHWGLVDKYPSTGWTCCLQLQSRSTVRQYICNCPAACMVSKPNETTMQYFCKMLLYFQKTPSKKKERSCSMSQHHDWYFTHIYN